MQVEAESMAQAIRALTRSGVKGSDIAVLYPKHVYGDRVEMKLLRHQLPYKRYGNTPIMDRCAPLRPAQHGCKCGQRGYRCAPLGPARRGCRRCAEGTRLLCSADADGGCG